MSELNQYKYARKGFVNRGVLNALYNVREIIPGAGLIALLITGMGASQYFLTNYYRDGWKVRLALDLTILILFS